MKKNKPKKHIFGIILINFILFLTIGTLIINLYNHPHNNPLFQLVRIVYSYVYLLVLIPFSLLFTKWITNKNPQKMIHISFLSFLGYGLINLIFLRQPAYGGIIVFWVIMLLLYVKYFGILFSKAK